MRPAWIQAVTAVTVLTFVAGCGVDVTIMGGQNLVPGQTAEFQVKLTNVSACPLVSLAGTGGPNFIFVPLVPEDRIGDDLIGALCTGDIFPNATDPNLALAGALPVAEAEAVLRSLGAGLAPASCSGPGATCELVEKGDDSVVVCELPPLAPGGMVTLSCQAQAGMAPGKFFNVAASLNFADGVCMLGPGQGEACGGDDDCGMGGICGNGICEGGVNAGNGCDTSSECPSGVCTICDDNEALGFACTQSGINSARGVPAASTWALTVMGVALTAIGAVAMRRRARAGR